MRKAIENDENKEHMADDDPGTLTENEAKSLARDGIDNWIPKPRGPLGYSQTCSLRDDLAKSCIAESLRNRENENGLSKRLYKAWNIVYST